MSLGGSAGDATFLKCFRSKAPRLAAHRSPRLILAVPRVRNLHKQVKLSGYSSPLEHEAHSKAVALTLSDEVAFPAAANEVASPRA